MWERQIESDSTNEKGKNQSRKAQWECEKARERLNEKERYK